MRAGSVDDARAIGRIDQFHRLAGGIVGQAEDRDIGFVERFTPGLGILALRIAKPDEGELAAPFEPLGDFEAGGARGTVDEDRVCHWPGASMPSRT